MTDSEQMIQVLENRVKRRDDRRDFFKAAIGAAAVGVTAMTFTSKAGAQTAQPSEADVLNFALNLEYLEAQFYSYAAFGIGLDASLLTGPTGTTPGAVTGGRKVAFTDQRVAQYAKEIAQDEIAHVTFLRSALKTVAVAQPAIDVGTAPTGAFSSAARAAGLIGAGASFDPYLNDENFLLGAFIFEDVGVTAYKGAASALINNKTYLEAAAGLLAVEAYHAAIVRTTLYAKGVMTPALRTSADAISDARDKLDGTNTTQVPEDTTVGKSAEDDQGISAMTVGNAQISNIVPLNVNGLAFSRTTGQVLNIVYLNNASVSAGGFFPSGMNGNIKMSAAN